MPPPNTKKPSQNTALVKFTEKHSPASASTGRIHKGRKAEELVLKHFRKIQFQLVAQRERFVGVEVDLLFKKDNELHIVEVKTYREGFPLIERKQFQRLKRVAAALGARHRSSVRLHLASVQSLTELHIHWDIGDEVQ